MCMHILNALAVLMLQSLCFRICGFDVSVDTTMETITGMSQW